MSDASKHIDIVFDGPPGPEAGRFVEVEDAAGKSIRIGEWIEQPDTKTWVLRIPDPRHAPVSLSPSPDALLFPAPPVNVPNPDEFGQWHEDFPGAQRLWALRAPEQHTTEAANLRRELEQERKAKLEWGEDYNRKHAEVHGLETELARVKKDLEALKSHAASASLHLPVGCGSLIDAAASQEAELAPIARETKGRKSMICACGNFQLNVEPWVDPETGIQHAKARCLEIRKVRPRADPSDRFVGIDLGAGPDRSVCALCVGAKDCTGACGQ